MYNKIYELCSTKNNTVFNNVFSNRAQYILNLLESLNIEYKVIEEKNYYFAKSFFNIFVPGNSDKFLCAHHDVVDVNSDNANDNSASIINMIAYKNKNPNINLLITDGEEPPFFGIGAQITSNYLVENEIPVKWILNLELTGKGDNFFIDKEDYTNLNKCIRKNFPNSFSINPPINDSFIFRNNNLDSNVITTADTLPDGNLNLNHLGNSHSPKDSIDKISIEDMQNFTENILDKIVKNC